MADHEQLLTLATEIVSAHVSNNAVPADQLATLIQQVFTTLATVEQKTAEPPGRTQQFQSSSRSGPATSSAWSAASSSR